ncbi:MAG TPA: PIG-L family deacetylase [Acidimicrobiales bacterium]|jgi:LmbE family N-acetylglucosaminyl deacetylase|nr:PIG-L family deacetylase [Acidimicrobiales bacterium]
MALTFLAVHAHPDDEASSTGGLFRTLADQRVRTVLVTCTRGEFGDAPGGIKPEDEGHDADDVAEIRKYELDKAVEILGISRSVRLGYRDSGMMGWPQNQDPGAFWSTPINEAAERLAAVLMEERPQVVVTYNEHGFYGHPDHIQAHRITMSALSLIDYEPTLYFNAIPNSVMAIMRARWEQEEREQRAADAAKGIERSADPEMSEEDLIEMGTPDEEIGAAIDVSAATDAKYDALAAHNSQVGESFWMKMSRDEFKQAMGTEWFVRVTNPKKLSGSVTDIFAGYR